MPKYNKFFGIENSQGESLKNDRAKFDIDSEIITNKADQDADTLKKGIFSQKLRWFFLVIILGFVVLILKTFSLQIVEGQQYRLRAENNRIKIERITPLRGILYDRNGEILVKNTPNFTLYIIPSELSEDQAEINDLIAVVSEITAFDYNEIANIINNSDKISNQPLVIKEYLDYDQALNLEIIIDEYSGLNLEVQTSREYQTNESFSHVLGYMGKITDEELKKNPEYSFLDYIGKIGIESFYESELRGEDGKRQVEKDNLNKLKRVVALKEPKAGNNIVLTIDQGLQNQLYDSLVKSVKKNNGIAGAAVALDPRNGEVLALVSYPSFDNNLFFKGLSQEDYNQIIENPQKPLITRPISGEYPPGSTIKPLIAASALEERIINESTTVLSQGGIQIDKWYFPDWKQGGHGQTNVIKAIAESVNTFFYAISAGYEKIEGMGLTKINEYLSLFGLNNLLGIDLPGEKNGFLPTKEWKENTKNERWYIGDTYHLAIGQGDILVTPLQVASYTSSIANGGILYRPHLVRHFTDLNNNLIKKINPEIINDRMVSQKNINIVKKGLREAVLSGSARSLQSLPFATAGKTGSAQYAKNKKTHAWFTSFAPYENPEIVITVIVESGGEGHVAALPVAKDGLNWYFSRK